MSEQEIKKEETKLDNTVSIVLNETELKALKVLSEATKKNVKELIDEAICDYLFRNIFVKREIETYIKNMSKEKRAP